MSDGDTSRENLLAEFELVDSDWRKLGSPFHGPSPEFTDDSDIWIDETRIPYDSSPDLDTWAFPHAWQEVRARMEELLLIRIAPLAERFLATRAINKRSSTSFRDPPSPS